MLWLLRVIRIGGAVIALTASGSAPDLSSRDTPSSLQGVDGGHLVKAARQALRGRSLHRSR